MFDYIFLIDLTFNLFSFEMSFLGFIVSDKFIAEIIKSHHRSELLTFVEKVFPEYYESYNTVYDLIPKSKQKQEIVEFYIIKNLFKNYPFLMIDLEKNASENFTKFINDLFTEIQNKN